MLRVVARTPYAATRCARCAWRASPPSSASPPTPETEPRSPATPPAVIRGLAGARLRRAPPPGAAPRECVEGLALADRTGVLGRCCPSSTDAARRRAEPLPPPRRLRPHGRGAGARTLELERDPTEVFGETWPRARRGARRAARRRADPRPGAALRRAAARRRQAGHAGRARPTGRVTFIGHDRGRRRDGPRPSAGGCATSERLRLVPRRRSPATTSCSASWSTSARCRGATSTATCAGCDPGRGRGHAALVRRPPGHPRPQRRARDRGRTSSSPRELMGPGAGVAGPGPAPRPAPRRRAGREARDRPGARARRAARPSCEEAAYAGEVEDRDEARGPRPPPAAEMPPR